MKKSAKKTVDKTTEMKYVSHIAKELGVHRATVHGWFTGTKPSPMAAALLKARFPKLYEEIVGCAGEK